MDAKRCSRCRLEKPLSEFWTDRRRGGFLHVCKPCSREKAREYRKAHPEKDKERYWREKEKERERHLLRKYGIDLAEYERLLSAQNGLCAICLAPESEQYNGVFHVDHCHETGRVRGLLCRGCNHLLGAIKDDVCSLRRAIEYLNSDTLI